jgi:hypothetical protein
MHAAGADARRAARFNDSNGRIARYLHTDDVAELYGYALDRVESACGRAATSEFLGLLWASRRGLTRAEMAAIAGRRDRAVARIVDAISHHLLWSGDIMMLSRSLRGAVEERYANGAARRRELRVAIARHFATEPVAARRAEEQPWQLHEAGEWDMLREALADADLTLAIHQHCAPSDLACYWGAIERRADLIALYEPSLEACGGGDREPLAAATLYYLLGDFHCNRGDDERGEALLRRSLAIRLAILGGDDPATAATSSRLAALRPPRRVVSIPFPRTVSPSPTSRNLAPELF